MLRMRSSLPHLVCACARVQASGGITIETMHEFFSPSVDIISQGALTNGYDTLDFSLKVPKPDAFVARARVSK